jgi:hypothetical protein
LTTKDDSATSPGPVCGPFAGSHPIASINHLGKINWL